MGQCPSANGAAVGHTLQLALAAEPRLAPGLQIASLQVVSSYFYSFQIASIMFSGCWGLNNCQQGN